MHEFTEHRHPHAPRPAPALVTLRPAAEALSDLIDTFLHLPQPRTELSNVGKFRLLLHVDSGLDDWERWRTALLIAPSAVVREAAPERLVGEGSFQGISVRLIGYGPLLIPQDLPGAPDQVAA